MISNKEWIVEQEKISGRRGRFEYLQSLVTEFQDTNKKDSKCQILANLANFAYDPINYEHLRSLNVIDLFLDILSEEVDSNMASFAIGGLCNLCLDPLNKEVIIKNDGIDLIVSCLSSSNENIVINAITTLMGVVDQSNKNEVVTEDIKECMKQLSLSENTRLKNIATVFLEDVIGE